MRAAKSTVPLAALAIALAAAGSAHANLSSAVRIVLQKARHYEPADVFLRLGDTITLINGDETSIHHAFIEADRFAFDAGDQEPGKQATLILRERGEFVIQCGIHPKMKLTLHVE